MSDTDNFMGDPACRRLMTMAGVGKLTALSFRAAIDDLSRFRHSADVGAYLGLTPRRYASGEIDRMGRISCCAGALTRSYLYEAANIMLTRSRGSNPLKAWGMKLGRRAGWKKARVAVVLHRMWRDGADFGAPKVKA
jgi:transposase